MHFTQKVTIEHEYKIGVALLEFVMKFYIGRHLVVKSPRRHFRFLKNVSNSLSVHFGQKVAIEHEYKVTFGLSGTVFEFNIRRHLAEKLL